MNAIRTADLGLLPMRVMVGAVFVYHGRGKLFGGLFRWALWPLVFTMMVAAFRAHAGKFGLQDGGMEHALTLGVVALGLILTGPGACSLQSWLSARGETGRTAAKGA